jgi:hypothetical protein
MSFVTTLVTANCITIGIIIAIASVTTLEVNREYFLNGIARSRYSLKFFN